MLHLHHKNRNSIKQVIFCESPEREKQNKKIKTADPVYDIAEIVKAIQSIQFSLDEKGDRIKSETGTNIMNLPHYHRKMRNQDIFM